MDENPNPKKLPDQKKLEMVRIAGQASLIPVYLAVFPLAYGFIGKWLDGYFQTHWLMLLFVLLGFFSGIRQSYFIIQRLKNTFKQD